MSTNLLVEELPCIRLRADVNPIEFFDRCEAIASKQGYGIERRREYAGSGYDQLNLNLNPNTMIRMVLVPSEQGRLRLDAVVKWNSSPIEYDEYINTIRQAYNQLLRDYAIEYGSRLRIRIPKRQPILIWENVNCERIHYTREKFRNAVETMAVGEGDVRNRLELAFLDLHVVQTSDLPSPLREHFEWVYHELTYRPDPYGRQGTLKMTLNRMRRSTGAKIAQRIVDISNALEELSRMCDGHDDSEYR